MTIVVHDDPDEGKQKRKKKMVFQRGASALLSLLRKGLVHRKTLMFGIKAAVAAYKLVKFIIELF